MSCVVDSWLFLVPSVFSCVCGCFMVASGCLSSAWRVWLFRVCFLFPQWLLACVVGSWLFLVASVVAGVCACLVVVSGCWVVAGVWLCFVVVSGSLGGCWRVSLFRGCFWFPWRLLACVVVSWLFLVPSVDCWRVWLSRGCYWFPLRLLACVVVSWLSLFPSVVAGVCGCFVLGNWHWRCSLNQWTLLGKKYLHLVQKSQQRKGNCSAGETCGYHLMFHSSRR